MRPARARLKARIIVAMFKYGLGGRLEKILKVEIAKCEPKLCKLGMTVPFYVTRG